MAGKWADYLVSGVRYDAAENCLDTVRVHSDNGATIGDDCDKKDQLGDIAIL